MAVVTFATPPSTTWMTTVARVNAQLGISGEDTKIATLIAAASDAAVEQLGYGVARAELTETFEGSGWQDTVLSWAPVLSLVEVRGYGSVRDLSGYWVHNALGSVVRAYGLWTETVRPEWSVRYWGGWLLPADDVTSTAISFAAADSSLNRAAGWPLLRPGDLVVVGGSTGNSGQKTVVSCSGGKLIVSGAIVNENAGPSITVAVSNMPDDLEQAVIEMVADLRAGSTSTAGGDVTSESVDGITVHYSSSSTGSSQRSAYTDSLLRRARVYV